MCCSVRGPPKNWMKFVTPENKSLVTPDGVDLLDNLLRYDHQVCACHCDAQAGNPVPVSLIAGPTLPSPTAMHAHCASPIAFISLSVSGAPDSQGGNGAQIFRWRANLRGVGGCAAMHKYGTDTTLLALPPPNPWAVDTPCFVLLFPFPKLFFFFLQLLPFCSSPPLFFFLCSLFSCQQHTWALATLYLNPCIVT